MSTDDSTVVLEDIASPLSDIEEAVLTEHISAIDNDSSAEESNSWQRQFLFAKTFIHSTRNNT